MKENNLRLHSPLAGMESFGLTLLCWSWKGCFYYSISARIFPQYPNWPPKSFIDFHIYVRIPSSYPAFSQSLQKNKTKQKKHYVEVDSLMKTKLEIIPSHIYIETLPVPVCVCMHMCAHMHKHTNVHTHPSTHINTYIYLWSLW